MSTRGRSPRLEMRLNIYPPRSPTPSSWEEFSETSTVEGSCVLSEAEEVPVVTRAMLLVGCPRCLMYVLSQDQMDPKCPNCKNTVLLDFLNEQNANIKPKKTN